MKAIVRPPAAGAPRKAFWYTQLEWIGNKTQVLPLIEYIVGQNLGRRAISDHSGVWMSGPESGLCDAAWHAVSATGAWQVYRALKKLLVECRRFTPYFRLRILYCDPSESMARRSKVLEQLKRGKFYQIPVRKLRGKRALPATSRTNKTKPEAA
jgi:hypothetical protein